MTDSSDLRRRAKAEGQAAVEAASLELERGVIDEAAWYQRVTGALAAAYLIDEDPRWQSGFDGDPELWRQARELVLEGVDRDGTFLDVGCATGHLMECLAAWALERGRRLSVYGLELNRDLADAARRRLPAWSERIFEGNVSDWEPPMKFTYVRTGLEYVPEGRGPFLLARLLRDVVEPGGRLIVGPVYGRDFDAAVAAFAAAGFPDPAVREAKDRNGKARYVLWVERRHAD
jgi:SAM-dependent methyltransferase